MIPSRIDASDSGVSGGTAELKQLDKSHQHSPAVLAESDTSLRGQDG